VSQQNGLDQDGTEPTGSSKPDHDDDGMQKKSENVAHAQDGIKLSKLKNSEPVVEFATNRTRFIVWNPSDQNRNDLARSVVSAKSADFIVDVFAYPGKFSPSREPGAPLARHFSEDSGSDRSISFSRLCIVSVLA
jgi:hypothetical protein